MPAFAVLLVDDEKEFVTTLARRLKKRNIEARVAVTGTEGLEVIEEAEPDVLVADLRMPDMSGLDILRNVKETHPEIQVVILTGHRWIEDEEEARRLGAFTCLEKPLSIEELVATLEEAYQAKLEGSKSSAGPMPIGESEPRA